MVDGRFFETQMPFVGVNNTYDLDFRTGVARLDLRYNIWGKSYISLIGNVLAKDNWGIDMRTFATVFKPDLYYGVALAYTYRSIIGPIMFDVHWSTLSNSVGAYCSFGFDF
jgi:NTE family protein